MAPEATLETADFEASTDYAAQIKEAEDMRERGNITEAQAKLERIVAETRKNHDYSILASALGQLIVCAKHQYENSPEKRSEATLLWFTCISDGLHLPIEESEKAVFYLRHAEFASLHKFERVAGTDYKQAYELVKDRKDFISAEYLGHFAEHKTRTGSYTEALLMLEKALRLLDESENVRPFHRLIIKSGLLAKVIEPALARGYYWTVLKAFAQGYFLTQVLAFKYEMPQRRKQYHQKILLRLKSTF